MKKLIVATLAFACSGFAFAELSTDSISSFTKTNDTAVCIVPSTGPAGSPVVTPRHLEAIVVGGTSGAGANIILYNSTFTTTAVPIITSITLNTVYQYSFEDLKINGICYTTQSNIAGVTIIYRK